MLADAHISSMGYLWFNVISQKGALKVAQKKSRTAFCNESCSKKTFFVALFLYSFGLMLEYANFTKKVRFLSIFVQFCGVIRIAK